MSEAEKTAVAKNDVPRRKRVRELVEAGALQTSEDYVRAAFIFQHGGEPSDFLVAHVLGIIATKMDGSGAWISAASLDRYLLNTGKPQIFGLALDDHVPFDRTLLTDRIRVEVCAPSIADRAKFMASIAKDPEHPLVVDPCMPDQNALLRSLVGKWMLTLRTATGEFAPVTLNFTSDSDGGLDMEVSSPAYPSEPDSQIQVGGNKLQIKMNGDVFDLVIHGDTMSGRYTSGAFSGAVVGVR